MRGPLLLLGAILFLSVNSREVFGECPEDNDGEAVHLPHESDCTLFYKCDWGTPVLQECPDGLHFNPTLQVCDWPEDAGCVSGSDGNSDDDEGGENNGDDGNTDSGNDDSNAVGECPADNDGEAVHLPHESDCTLFYKCDWGTPVLQECPDGLHFNPTLEVCDWPEDAGCVSGSNGNSDDDEDGENNGDDGNTTDSGNDDSNAVGECPVDNDGEAVHLPHESDCTLFYKCDWGTPVLQECPDGLHFNPTLQVCDWPEDAGCVSGSEGNSNDGEDGDNDGEDGNTGDSGNDDSNAVGECPADNDGEAVHLPHESDCTLFYKCDWGTPVLQECPDGLHFNPTLQVCDWPEDAGCVSGSDGNSDDGEDGDNDGEDGNTGDSGNDDSNAVGECPADNDGEAVHLPHESDCTLFYKCDWGTPVLQECPDGLHFNPTLQVCDWPEDAGCVSGSDGNSDDGEDGDNDGEDGNTGDSGNDDSNAVGECPADNDGEAVHLPHESDCTLFYKCDWGTPVLQECPDGLHFNPTLQVCDWPEDAGCVSGSDGNSDDGKDGDNDGEDGNTGDSGNDDSNAVGECPADNDGEAVHLPHESDCTLFYKCDWGTPVLQECPDGLHFNPTLQVCDWPEDAGCVSGSDGNSDDGEDGENNGDDGNTGDSGNDESNAVGECPADNDGEAVHLPHESDCTLFYKCDWGTPVLQECPDGLHFNPTLQVCDWPEDAGCVSGSDGNSDDGEDGDNDGEDGNTGDSGNDDSNAVGECPADNNGEAVHLPHESDCTLFYKCDWGTPVLQECPDGLHFNPTLQVCDWPEDAGCVNGSDGNSDDDEDGENNGDDGNTGDSGNDDSNAVGECPADNDGEAVHLPHESDCTLFYKCDWGIPVLQECPDGLHFNPTLQVCDWPEDAGCVSGSDGNSDDGEDGDNDGEDGNIGDSGNDDSNAVGECPADNDGEAVHLPHESDCTLFYKCDWGTPVLQECPDGLHFNPTLQVCDWPEDAECVSGSDGNSDDGEDGDNDGEDGNTGDSGNDDTNAVGECPADNDGEAVHLPHESDCTLFYKCDWGTPVLQECPDGLHFNPTLQVCDWPEDAGCVSGSDGNSDDGEDGDNDGEDGNTGDSGNDDSNAVGECPADNDGEAVHLPHESDCILFYKCDWGTPVLQECPDGLHFNPTLQVCDWPEDAGCVSGSDGNSDDGEDGDNDGEDGNTGDSGNDDSNAVGECPADNDGEAVHLPHESDCTLFYKCDWGTPVLQECPDGLHFNPTLQVCDWPEDAGCVSGSDGNSDDGEDGDNDGEDGNTGDSGNDDSNAVGECPADNDGEAVHLPHESDCTLFYKCDWGTPVLQECPDGLHFNPTLQVCDWPEDAGCVSGSDGNSDDGEDGDNDGEDGNTGDSGNDDSNAVGECPADNDGEAVHLPHESDCTLFYKCDWGTPVLQECPDGLHFNPTLQVCDWPEDAGCVSGSDGNSDDGEDGDNDGEDGNTGDSGNDDSNAVGECPADNDGEAVHLPHESDCTLFYKCDWGTPVLQECPDGLHFNPTLQVCDWPEDAGCVSGSDGNSDDGEDGDNDGEDGNTGDSGNDDSNAVGECPADNDGEAVHLPHESDCTLFYKCDWGTPVLQECPVGLHFNPTLQVCDWPEDAGCVSGSDGNSDDGEDGDNDGEDGNTGDSGNDDSNAVGECPADNDGEAVHLPHESDCTLFYKCDWGTPVLQECPDGLHFNPTLQVCDWPEDAGCVSGSDGNSDDGEDGDNDGEDGNTSDSGNDDSNAVGECPADNDGEAVHLPHESDCTLFYKCDWGTPVLQECPVGLHFNPTLQVCDWPEDAGCVSGSDGNSDDGEDGDNDGEDGNTGDSGNDDSNAVGECPADNDGEAVHLPHESDCTLFYKCDWGTPVLQVCPDGLHFNPTLEVCDWPEDAGCVSGSDGNSDDGEDGENDGEDGNTGDSGNDDSNAVGECPADNDGEAVHLPHESDCTLFYKCDWGTPVLQECPDDLHFNPTLQVCDWPENAGCVSGSGGNSDGEDGENDGEDGNDNDDGGNDNGENDGENVENDSDGENDEEDNNNDGTGFCNSVSCPAENEEYVTFIPNDNDCTRFCKCNWGLAYEYVCPDGLYFNPTLNVCDWPEDSGCVM